MNLIEKVQLLIIILFASQCGPAYASHAAEFKVIKLPYTLSNWKGEGVTHIFCNKRMELPLWRALSCVRGRNLIIRTYDGCYSHRYIRGTQRLSKHAEGLAIDIDAKWNMPGTEGELSPKIVECFKQQGFIWGGQWKIKDPMHFELPELKKDKK